MNLKFKEFFLEQIDTSYITKVVSFLQSKLNSTLFPLNLDGEPELVQSNPNTYGFKYALQDGKIIRLNYSKPQGGQIAGVDLWTGNHSRSWDHPDSSITFDLEDQISIVQLWPIIVQNINNPVVSTKEVEVEEVLASESLLNESVRAGKRAEKIRKLISLFTAAPKQIISKKDLTTHFWYNDLSKLVEYINSIYPEAISLEGKGRGSFYKLNIDLKEINYNDFVGAKVTVSPGKRAVAVLPQQKQAEDVLAQEDWSDPNYIFEDMRNLVSMVAKGLRPSLVITGGPGLGKTFNVLKTLKDVHNFQEDVDFVIVKGAASDFGLYEALFINNGKLIVFDDCDDVLNSDRAINILKGALDSYDKRTISWMTKNPNIFNSFGMDSAEIAEKYAELEKLPSRFNFEGSIIFISNYYAKDIDEAVLSRSLHMDVRLKVSDIFKLMEKILPKIGGDVDIDTKKAALNELKKRYQKPQKKPLTLRTLLSAISFAQSGLPNWQRMVNHYT